jgi:hypothetical protein
LVVGLGEDTQITLELLVVAEVDVAECQIHQPDLLVEAGYNQPQHLVVMETLVVHQLLVEEVALQHVGMVEAEQVVQEGTAMVLQQQRAEMEGLHL